MSSGPIYMRLDTARDGLHAFPITRAWKEVTNGVDAVFSHTDKLYMIKVFKIVSDSYKYMCMHK